MTRVIFLLLTLTLSACAATGVKMISQLPGAHYKLGKVIDQLNENEEKLKQFKFSVQCEKALVESVELKLSENTAMRDLAQSDQTRGLSRWQNNDETKEKFDKYTSYQLALKTWSDDNKSTFEKTFKVCARKD